ncbi:MAG: inositol monophosphatase family protein [Candidatus Nezhaarchaeales archaeon]
MLRNVIVEALMSAKARFAELKGSDEAYKELGIGAGGDVMRLLDFELEKVIMESITKDLGAFTLVSEESGVKECGKGEYVVVVDPLDGSTNALRGYPACSTAIAIAKGGYLKDVVAAGVINLVTGDLYYAEKGSGAYLNNSKIKPRNISKVEEALIAFELNVRGQINGYVSRIAEIIEKARHVRLIGSDALEICFIASGTSDAFIDLRGFLRAPDFAASTFILKEAGGVVTDAYGNMLNCKLDPKARSTIIATCTMELHRNIVSRLREIKEK